MKFTVDATDETKSIRSLVAAPEFESGLEFFVNKLGFKIVMISPADNPNYAILNRDQFTIALDKSAKAQPLSIEIPIEDQSLIGTDLIGPNGTRVKYVPVIKRQNQVIDLHPIVHVSRISDTQWVQGRAGMSYRSLTGNHNEISVASQIRIEGSGKVADWVHYHDVSFQTLFCINGSAKLVYEDQGEPFMFKEGDCILQPPGIRHQVLESFDDLEVIEVTTPADHATFSDFNMELPNSTVARTRNFNGQQFTHDTPNSREPVTYKDSTSLTAYGTSIGEASGNQGWVNEIHGSVSEGTRLTPTSISPEKPLSFFLWFINQGSAQIEVEEREETVSSGDAICFPYGFLPSMEFFLVDHDSEFKVLEVAF
tara:strand:+ start:1163 stop:2266 length:1104 start_codon:yes stop_codon:yes gene_type:complete